MSEPKTIPSVLKAEYEGKLKLGDLELNVAVLEDGTRLISRNAIFRAFERTKRGRAKDEMRVLNRPSFIDARNLQPLIDEQLDAWLYALEYIDLSGKLTTGYNALILPKLCKVYLDARSTINPQTGKPFIAKNQMQLALVSERLLFALSSIGIIALIDEATGYQYERERDELQKILKAYISEDLIPWQKTFPDIYYKEIFRLNGWDYTVRDIKKRPGVVGKWTNKLIYEQLPKDVLTTLKKQTPKSPAGNYTARFFQSLTPDVGNPHLQGQLSSVLTLFQISDNWKQLISNFNKLVDRRRGQLEISFEDLQPAEEKPKLELNQFDKNLKGLLTVPPPRKDQKEDKTES
jgi:hypothetical protein